MRLTHVGLFEGSGIPSLCAKNAGFTTIAQCESDPCCLYCLKRLWPDAIHYGDVRTADWEQIKEPTTLLTAGVPCQPVSCAGKQMGEKDERWLWPDTIRAVRELRPSWVVFENPPTIRLHGLERIVAELEDFGYIFIPKSPLGDFTPLQIGAHAVGAPHKRERVWIVGYAGQVMRGARRNDEDGDASLGEQAASINQQSSQAMADTNQPGRKEYPCLGSDPREERTAIERNRWPARPGERQHEWEAPRLIEFGMGAESTRLAGRILQRLGGSGNGIPPHQASSRTNKSLLRMIGNGWQYEIPFLLYCWIRKQACGKMRSAEAL